MPSQQPIGHCVGAWADQVNDVVQGEVAELCICLIWADAHLNPSGKKNLWEGKLFCSDGVRWGYKEPIGGKCFFPDGVGWGGIQEVGL